MINNDYVKRMMELEEMIEKNEFPENLTWEEQFYIKKAMSIPFKELAADIKGHAMSKEMDDLLFYHYLLDKYSCSDQDMRDRYGEVKALIKYQNYLAKKEKHESKSLIKKIFK